MSTQSVPTSSHQVDDGRDTGRNVDLRDNRTQDHVVKETRRSFQTTEFFAMIGAIAAVIVVGYGNEDDSLNAERIWMYVTIIASAYMISRGLAKAGSRDSHERY